MMAAPHDWTLSFPSPLLEDVDRVVLSIPPSDFESPGLISRSSQRDWPSLRVSDETVSIPYRIYNAVPTQDAVNSLSERERVLLSCVYTRHWDGFVRQHFVRSVLSTPSEYTAPFVVQLLGEYVVEIASDILVALDGHGGSNELSLHLRGFSENNPGFLELTNARAKSYWAYYYRRTWPASDDYPALRALRRIGAPAIASP